MLEFVSLSRRLMIIFLNFLNSIRAHVRYRAFATLRFELYHVVDYDSKWSTKFHNDCMLEVLLNFTFKSSYDNFFNFLNSIRAHVRYRAFATFQIELYRVVDYDSKWSTKVPKDCMLEIFHLSFKTSFDNFINLLNSIRDHVRYRAFETRQIELYRVVV